MKKQPTEWEQTFVVDETSRTYFPKYTNNSIKKIFLNGRRYKWTFFQRRHTDGQKAHEKMLNVANY